MGILNWMAVCSMAGSTIDKNSCTTEWINGQNLVMDSVCIRLSPFIWFSIRSRLRDYQFISDTCHCFDLYAAGFDLPAQVRHVDIHSAGLTIEIEAPRFLQNLLAAEHESAVFGQGEKKVKFLRTQVEAARVDPYLPPGGIDHQVPEVHRCGLIHL